MAVNKVRQKNYVSRLRVAVKQVANAYQWYKIHKAEPRIARMAPHPTVGLASFQRPFTHSGLDLFEPQQMKVGRSNAKWWIAIFTCLTIRGAVQVEVVHSLSTASWPSVGLLCVVDHQRRSTLTKEPTFEAI